MQVNRQQAHKPPCTTVIATCIALHPVAFHDAQSPHNAYAQPLYAFRNADCTTHNACTCVCNVTPALLCVCCRRACGANRNLLTS